MKEIRKIIALMLVIAMTLSCVAAAAYRDDDLVSGARRRDRDSDSTPTDAATSTDASTPTDTPVDYGNKVCRMYMCYVFGVRISTGHAWVYFENLTDHDITVGAYKLPPKQGVSVGTFCFSVSDGPGVYYNVESYNMTKDAMAKTLYIYIDLDQKTLDKVSDQILLSNYWSFIHNCLWFATKVWNSGGGKHQPTLGTAMTNIIFFYILCSPQKGLNMYRPDKSRVYRQIGLGDYTYLTEGTGKTVSAKVG